MSTPSWASQRNHVRHNVIRPETFHTIYPPTKTAHPSGASVMFNRVSITAYTSPAVDEQPYVLDAR